MSYCSEVKSEICNHKLNKRCCKRAEFWGLALGVKTQKDGRITFKTSNSSVAERVAHGMRANGIECDVVKLKNEMYNVVSLNKVEGLNRSLSSESKSCCMNAFIRGVFLACGQLSNPGNAYRIDFNFNCIEDAEILLNVLNSVDFEPRISQKANGKATLYIKNSTQVEDLMTYMGAPLSSLGLMEIRVEKDYKNHINRAVNFETANYVRSFDAGELQVFAIEKIKSENMFDSLSDETKTVANARLENADASLNRLAEITGLSKSSVNRRLKSIVELSNKI